MKNREFEKYVQTQWLNRLDEIRENIQKIIKEVSRFVFGSHWVFVGPQRPSYNQLRVCASGAPTYYIIGNINKQERIIIMPDFWQPNNEFPIDQCM
jgi:hypothetical protein